MRTITEPFTLSNDGLVDIRKGKDAQEAEATTTSACSSSDSSSSLSDRVPSRSIFLTPDQRYEIWLVKAAERPELLGRYTDDDSASRSEHETSDGSSDGEDSSNLPLPFTDGCDIDGWRRHGLARPTKTKDVSLSGKMTTRQRSSPSFSPYWQAVFNVGQGCTLFRRDGQLPLLPTSMNDDYIRSPWNALKERLSVVRPHRHHSPNGIERIHYSDIVHRHSITPFSYSVRPHFEQHNYPVVLLDCTDNWKATHSCQFDSLVERFGHLHWRFSDTHAETITLQTYNKYLREGALVDDAPLAVYDSQFAEMLDDGDDISDNTDGNYEQKSTRLDERACLLEDYEVPICFQHDLFDLLEQRDRVARPPYRWILIGPERSGTGLHIDPVGTHAWVTLGTWDTATESLSNPLFIFSTDIFLSHVHNSPRFEALDSFPSQRSSVHRRSHLHARTTNSIRNMVSRLL